jgi:hypothetical protein
LVNIADRFNFSSPSNHIYEFDSPRESTVPEFKDDQDNSVVDWGNVVMAEKVLPATKAGH